MAIRPPVGKANVKDTACENGTASLIFMKTKAIQWIQVKRRATIHQTRPSRKE